MKKVLLCGPALLAATVTAHAADVAKPTKPVVVAPVVVKPAIPPVSGDLLLYGGWTRYTNNSSDSHSGSIIGGLGRANVWTSPTTSWQLDLNAENVFFNDTSLDYSVVNLAAHWSHRNAPGQLWGVFGSIGANGYAESRFGTIGAEFQHSSGNMQFYAQGGYTGDIAGNNEGSGWYIHGEARIFHTPNTMLAANLGFAGINENGTHHSIVRWGIDFEMKHDNNPFGLFVSYRGNTDREPDESERATSHALLAGVKVYLGGMTLQQQAMSGATLVDRNPLTGVNHVILFDYQ
jgi:hypothetical protein